MTQSQKSEKKENAAAEATELKQPQEELQSATAANLEGRERKAEEAEAQAKEFAKQYAPYLMADDSLPHHLEQLYLMVREGMQAEFIRRVFCEDTGISEVSLDLLRCMAVLGGEEFAMKFFRQSFTLSKARDALADQAAREKYRQFDEIGTLETEVEKMRESFDIQMEFLKREQDHAKAYADELIKNQKEAAGLQLESVRSQFEAEKELLLAREDARKGELERDLSECTDKLETAQSESDYLRVKLEEEQEKNNSLTLQINAMKQQKEKSEENAPVKQSRGRGSGRFFAKKEQPKLQEEIRKSRNELIFRVLSDPDFNERQLDIITHAIGAGLDKEVLEKLCNPKLPAQNMEIFEDFCLSEQLNFPGKGGDAK